MSDMQRIGGHMRSECDNNKSIESFVEMNKLSTFCQSVK